MSRTWIETAEHGSVIMHCVECPDWTPEMRAEPFEVTLPSLGEKTVIGGIPAWKITHLAASHVQAAHGGKPHP